MEEVNNLGNVCFKQATSIGVGDHHTRHIFTITERFFESFDSDTAGFFGRDHANFKATHGGGCRIGAVGGVRDKHHISICIAL